MKLSSALLSLTLLLTTQVIGQTRTITGKIIDDHFYPIYDVGIYNADTILLGKSRDSGIFTVTIPSGTKFLIIAAIALEWKRIEWVANCDKLEIILLNSGSYDFMSARKVDRLRKKYFDKLSSLHQTAFEKDIFNMNKPCYVEKFIPIKQNLDEIHRKRTQTP